MAARNLRRPVITSRRLKSASDGEKSSYGGRRKFTTYAGKDGVTGVEIRRALRLVALNAMCHMGRGALLRARNVPLGRYQGGYIL